MHCLNTKSESFYGLLIRDLSLKIISCAAKTIQYVKRFNVIARNKQVRLFKILYIVPYAV